MKSKSNQKVLGLATALGTPSKQDGKHRQVTQVNGTSTVQSGLEWAIDLQNDFASISDAELAEFFCSEAGAGMAEIVEQIMFMTTRFVELQKESLKIMKAFKLRINEQVERGVQPGIVNQQKETENV